MSIIKSLEFIDRCWGLSQRHWEQWHKYKKNSVELGEPQGTPLIKQLRGLVKKGGNLKFVMWTPTLPDQWWDRKHEDLPSLRLMDA